MIVTDWLKIAALSILFFAETAVVTAQEVARGETVTTRPRPDYDAVGAPVGGFLLFPEATLDFVWDDNILAADKAKTPDLVLEDAILLLAPQLELRSNWSKNALNVGGRALSARYNEYASQDFTDYEVWTDGELEFGPNLLEANISHSELHEERTSSNEQGIFPTEFTLDNVGIGYRYSPSRFFVGAAFELSQYDFDNVLGLNNMGDIVVIDNQDRDRDDTELRLRVGYLLSPSYSVFLGSRIYDFDYETDVDRYGNNLDQNGYDIIGGSEFDMTEVTSGEIFVGYRNIDYDDPAFKTQDGPTFGASVDWNITQLTTLTFTGSQRLYGTTVQNSSGIEAVALGIAADHELRRNVILSLNLDTINEDYLQITRKDDVVAIRLGARYLLNRNWSLNAGYIYQERESNVSTAREFKVNQFYLGIRGQI